MTDKIFFYFVTFISLAGNARSSACLECRSGKYNPAQGATSEKMCTLCRVGKYSDTAAAILSSSCRNCPVGFQQQHTGSSFCRPCLPGFAASIVGSAICQQCSIGKYSSTSAATTFNSCLMAPLGKYASSEGTNAFAVPGGYKGVQCLTNSSGCSGAALCQSGKYGSTPPSQQCNACPAGYTSSSGMQRCFLCERGKFSSKRASPSCNSCGFGKFQDKEGGTHCFPCPLGKTTLQLGGTACVRQRDDLSIPSPRLVSVCPPLPTIGRINMSVSFVVSDIYDVGRGSARSSTIIIIESSMDKLFRTPEKIVTHRVQVDAQDISAVKTGLLGRLAPPLRERLYVRVAKISKEGTKGKWTSPVVCACGFDSWRGDDNDDTLDAAWVANSCTACDDDVVCVGGYSPFTKQGYWNVPWVVKPKQRLPCPTPMACLGPASWQDVENSAWLSKGNESNQCAPLYTGPLCASCTREAYRDTLAITPQCLKCSDDQAASINFVVLMIVAVVVVIAVICYVAVTKISGKETAILKIAINSFAISSAVSQIPLAWSSSVLGMFQLYTVASVSAIGDAFAADCAVARTSDMRPVQAWALGMIMMPLGVVVLWFVAAVLANVCAKKNKANSFISGMNVPGPVIALQKSAKEKSTNYLSTHLPGAVLVTLILAHQGVTKAAVELINCRTIAGRRFLEADVQIECTSNEYTTWANGVAVPMLIVYTIGFPLVYFVMLCTHVRAGIHEDKHHIYGYLLANFKTNAWWYEFWNVFRKALLSILVVTLNTSGTPVQSWGALLVLLVSVAVFAVARPYKEEYLNVLEATSLSVNIFTLMFGMGMYNGAFVAVQLNQASDTMGESTTETTESIVLSILILGINVIWIAKVLYDGFHSLLRNTLVFPAQSAQSAEQKKKSKHNKSSTGSNNKRKSGRKTNISLQKGTLSIAPILISLLILFPTTAYCSSCAKGQYTHPQNGGCSSCSPGMYNDQTSQRGCRSCNGGEFQNSYGATSCKKCSAGYYSVSNPLSGCSGGGDYTADYGTSRNALIGQLYRQILCRCADSAGRKFIYELHFVGFFWLLVLHF